jgi:hypothetical protein
MYRLLPGDRAALEALAVQIEQAVSDLTPYQDNLKAYHRAEYLLGHPQCPPDARARLEGEIERLRPIASRRPAVSLLVQSYMLPHSVECLRTGALAGLRVAIAYMENLHRAAREALDGMPKGDLPVRTKRPAVETTKRHKPGDPALLILSALESLAEEGVWDVAESEIIMRSGVPRSTYYNVLKNDKSVKKVMQKYRQRRLGKGPSFADDL